jgi:hypothetical protein
MLKRITISIIALSLLATPPVAGAKTSHTCPQYEAQLRKHGLPVKQFSYIMWRESRCNPKAVSSQNGDGSYDYGALQVNSTWRTVTARICNRPYRQVKKSLLKFDCNLRVSKYLYENGGLGHWRITSGSK